MTVGGALVAYKASPVPKLHEIVDWDHSWDMEDAILYDDAGTERVHMIPDGSGNRPLIRDQGWYGAAYSQPTCKGPLHIASSPRFKGHRAMISVEGVDGSCPMLSTTPDPTDSSTWFGGTSGMAQAYWCICCLRPFEDPSGHATGWDAMQGSMGTTVSLFTSLSGTNWGCTTGVRGGLDPWPDTGYDQDPNATALAAVLVAGQFSWFELNVVDERGMWSRRQKTPFVLSEDAPAREFFFGWLGRCGYWNFAAVKQGAPTDTEMNAARTFALHRMPATTIGTPLGAEP